MWAPFAEDHHLLAHVAVADPLAEQLLRPAAAVLPGAVEAVPAALEEIVADRKFDPPPASTDGSGVRG